MVHDFVERSGQAEVFKAIDPISMGRLKIFSTRYKKRDCRINKINDTHEAIEDGELDEHQNILNFQDWGQRFYIVPMENFR